MYDLRPTSTLIIFLLLPCDHNTSCLFLQGFIVIGANLHFSKGLREMITGNI